MAAVVSKTDLSSLLRDYQSLAAVEKTDAQKLKEVEGQIAQAVAKVDIAQLPTQLPAPELETLRSIAQKDAFEKIVYSWGGDIGLLREAFGPKSAADAQAQRTEAVTSQLTQRAEQNAKGTPATTEPPATVGQGIFDRQVAGQSTLAAEWEKFIGGIKDPRVKKKFEKDWQDLQTKVAGREFEAEGFQSSLMKKALAHLAGEKTDLTKAQKAALDSAFPVSNEQREALVAAARAGLPAEGPERNALNMLAKAETTKSLTEEQKEFVAKTAAGRVAESGAAAPVEGSGGLLSRAQAMALPDPARTRALEFVDAHEKYARNADRAYREMMGLLNSGLPIEVVIALFMATMSDRSEEKLKLKMKEQAMNEQIAGQIDRLSKNIQEKKNAGITEGLEADEKALAAMNAIPLKSSMLLNSEVQNLMNAYSQMNQALGGVTRMLQDMVAAILRMFR